MRGQDRGRRCRRWHPALRLGNAGANTAADHLEVLAEAFAQIPTEHRRRLLVRGDSAAAAHAVLDWLVEQNRKRGRSVEYSIGDRRTGTDRDRWHPHVRVVTSDQRRRRIPAVVCDLGGGGRGGLPVVARRSDQLWVCSSIPRLRSQSAGVGIS
uniref:hypothetical protein n=1 Tax=Phytohabitans aurantiacus TaxID=3016789 RepID=UPI00249274B6|nr:hypothetical protein [Phytohabitans aurantiacus]